MKTPELLKLHYPKRIKWIDHQLKNGKELGDIFDLTKLPAGEDGIMSGRVNIEVMRQWKEFTSTRNEKSQDLLSLALCDFMNKSGYLKKRTAV